MALSVGIVGLPNVGKSTVFNALTAGKAEARPVKSGSADDAAFVLGNTDPAKNYKLSYLAYAVPSNAIRAYMGNR